MRVASVLALAAIVRRSTQLNLTAKTNVAVYYGQGPNQQELLHFCQQPTIDIIVLSFVHLFPAQAGGLPGTNFGNQCSGAVFRGPGADPAADALQASCPQLAAQIPLCQRQYGKTVLLSLGGGTDGYQLAGARDGVAFADLLWGIFGPKPKEWTGPRPFDAAGAGGVVEMDGFDFDIEHASPDGGAGYVSMAQRLRSLAAGTGTPGKTYYLSASPQCVVPDANMAALIRGVKLDMLFLQYYNTPQCSAASFAAANPPGAYTPGQAITDYGGFSFDTWVAWLDANIPTGPIGGRVAAPPRLLIGLPGAPAAASAGQYVAPAVMAELVDVHYCRPQFAGVAIWEATYADGNVAADGKSFYAGAKASLLAAAADARVQNCPAG